MTNFLKNISLPTMIIIIILYSFIVVCFLIKSRKDEKNQPRNFQELIYKTVLISFRNLFFHFLVILFFLSHWHSVRQQPLKESVRQQPPKENDFTYQFPPEKKGVLFLPLYGDKEDSHVYFTDRLRYELQDIEEIEFAIGAEPINEINTKASKEKLKKLFEISKAALIIWGNYFKNKNGEIEYIIKYTLPDFTLNFRSLTKISESILPSQIEEIEKKIKDLLYKYNNTKLNNTKTKNLLLEAHKSPKNHLLNYTIENKNNNSVNTFTPMSFQPSFDTIDIPFLPNDNIVYFSCHGEIVCAVIAESTNNLLLDADFARNISIIPYSSWKGFEDLNFSKPFDDIWFEGTNQMALTYMKLSDDFESGLGDWYTNKGIWEVGSPISSSDDRHSGQNCAGTVLSGNYPLDYNSVYEDFDDAGWTVGPSPGFDWGSTYYHREIDIEFSRWNYMDTCFSQWIQVPLGFRMDAVEHNPKITETSGVGCNIIDSPGWYVDEVTVNKTDLCSNSNAIIKNRILPVNYNNREISPTSKKTYALLIGISEYKDISIPNLEFASKDAKDLYSLLKGNSNVDANLLIGNKATRENILTEMNVIMNNSSKDDSLIVYFAGHGIRDISKEKDERYLAPFDFNFNAVSNTGITIDEIKTILQQSELKNAILVVDACHSGKFQSPKKHHGSIKSSNKLKGEENNTGILLLSSTSANEFAMEGTKWKNGLFTEYLLSAFKGHADQNHDNEISVDELYSYIKDNVIRESSGLQAPTLSYLGTIQGNKI